MVAVAIVAGMWKEGVLCIPEEMLEDYVRQLKREVLGAVGGLVAAAAVVRHDLVGDGPGEELVHSAEQKRRGPVHAKATPQALDCHRHVVGGFGLPLAQLLFLLHAHAAVKQCAHRVVVEEGNDRPQSRQCTAREETELCSRSEPVQDRLLRIVAVDAR